MGFGIWGGANEVTVCPNSRTRKAFDQHRPARGSVLCYTTSCQARCYRQGVAGTDKKVLRARRCYRQEGITSKKTLLA
jgi:hypothetical protein